MTTAEKAKEAVLERVIELAKTAEITDLFALTNTISHVTGESDKHLDALYGTLTKILERPNFGEPKNKGDKK